MKTKRCLSVLLCVVILLGTFMFPAYADSSDISITFAAQKEGGFIFVPQKISVADGIAEEYGYSVAEGITSPTFLDALVAAHKLKYGDLFTKETAKTYLDLSAEGWILTSFKSNEPSGLYVNSAMSDLANAQTVKNGDVLEYFFYMDTVGYSDKYTCFDESEKCVETGKNFDLTLSAVDWNGNSSPVDGTDEETYITINTVNSDGSISEPLETAIDANGKITLCFDADGIYIVTAQGYIGSSPIAAPICTVTAQTSETDFEALVKTVYDEFSNKQNNYSSAANTPITLPITYNDAEYTNVLSYLKAYVKDKTGFEPEIKFDYVASGSSFDIWTSGESEKYKPSAFDESGEMTPNYFKDNEPQSQRLSNVYFTIGTATSERVPSIYAKTDSVKRTPEEIVDFVSSNFPFVRIKGNNASENEIVQALATLPAADTLYTKKTAAISWRAENISGNADALKIANGKTTVTRPEIGEDDAVFKLIATVTSAENNDISKDIEYTLTVPAFEAVYMPIKVTKGASLTVTDTKLKKNVSEKYIVKQDAEENGYDLYICALHTTETGGSKAYGYTAKLENHITKTGSITVKSGDLAEETVIDLPPSTADDSKLEKLEISAPQTEGFEFDKDKFAYSIKADGAQYVKIAGKALTSGATAKITSYYKSLANANKGTLTTTGTNLTESGVKCYLPDSLGETVIKISVTAPDGSIQQQKVSEYTITVEKISENKPLTGLVIKAYSSQNGKTDTNASPNEETLSPEFVAGARAESYQYTTNYFRDLIKITPTADNAEIKVNGKTVKSKAESEAISLNTGDNEVVVEVTKNGQTTPYTITVHRKENLVITDVTLDGGFLSAPLKTDGSDRTGSCNFYGDTDKIYVTYHTNEKADIAVVSGDETYTGTSGEPIEIFVGDKNKFMPTTKISRTVNGVFEEQTYVISFNRVPSDAPSSVESYLPAPGQFVNVSVYQNPGVVLKNDGYCITLGSFGGYAVYKYDTPIKNDSKNIYGIDFIVFGNAFINDDGSTSTGAAEPAAVAVSKDGKVWYELAGSMFYHQNTQKNVTVTYTNGDTAFSETKATDTMWTASNGESGILPANSYNKHAYYPNPAYYSEFQKGVGKNDTYNDKTVSFTGNMIEPGFYPFGYADSHSMYGKTFSNAAANPYVSNHEKIYNGDGFDISWAVDENGDPVSLDEISYVKIYNPVLAYYSSTGEKSPEISLILKAKSDTENVGVTENLSSLYVNGEEIKLSDGHYTYDIDAKKADILEIVPTSSESGANIYVSDQYVNSGEKCKIATVKKTRIIVQEGKKEPVIYILNINNTKETADSAALLSLGISPGDTLLTPGENKTLTHTVSNSVSAIKLTPKTLGNDASVKISQDKKSIADLKNGEESALINLSEGKNTFSITVTSENGEYEDVYTLEITRKTASSSPSDSEITVSFTMLGDEIHYDKKSESYTSGHKDITFIKTQNVVVPKNSTVKYLTELMLNNNGIKFTSTGKYISQINGIGEFDNGPKSGWMYKVNGVIVNTGYADKKLSDGDKIVWFYTDNYLTEENYEEWTDTSSSKSSAKVTEKNLANTAETGKLFDGKTFADVKESDWYYNAVKFVYEKGIMSGTENGFEPEAEMSRAMLVTVLWRMENSPVVNYAMPFGDISEDWYREAVRWAVSKGIVSGISDSLFDPDGSVSREQTAAILYRYAKNSNFDISADSANLDIYSDRTNISEYALTAMNWAVEKGIIKGVSSDIISPDTSSQRAQIAQMLMRFYEKFSK